MKIAIIGGAGVRTPILATGLASSDLPVKEISLCDPDRDRLRMMADLTSSLFAQRAPAVRLTIAETARDAARDAAFVFTSIRPGGISARARDERAALDLGMVGQETVGPAGCAMALRTIPAMVDIVREIAAAAPNAWIISFTNPVGAVTQAVRQAVPGARIIGICDTPTELFHGVALALGAPVADCKFDYVGLNHLGFLREVYVAGVPQMADLLARPQRATMPYRTPLFPPELLAGLGALPTEYLYYYYRPNEAIAHLQAAGRSRGETLGELNRSLFADLGSGSDPAEAYSRYLATRNGSYMQLESGAAAPIEQPPWAELTGYDRMGVDVARAIHFDTGEIMPLNVDNRGNLPELADEDVVEVPCVIGAAGPRALQTGPLPSGARSLVVAVKQYERLTIDAAFSRNRDVAVAALATNPLVGDRDRADAYLNATPPW